MTSEPTKAAMSICEAWWYSPAEGDDLDVLALAIDAHTSALRAENARLREQVRLAVEYIKACRKHVWTAVHSCGGADPALAKAADEAFDALRAAGVEI